LLCGDEDEDEDGYSTWNVLERVSYLVLVPILSTNKFLQVLIQLN
jgi:hypothetical protein